MAAKPASKSNRALHKRGRKSKSGTPQAEAAQYDVHRAKMAAKSAERSRAGRDIGPIPPVQNSNRRAMCERDFRLFCETYFPLAFALAWSPDHLKVISRIETVVLDGGTFALAMPRGSGKSTLCETACLWALLYGHRSFVVFVAADEPLANQMLDSLRTEIEINNELLADFPEVCFPVRALEGNAQRVKAQLCEGERTRLSWTAKELRFPAIKGSASFGALIKVTGITGRIVGLKEKSADGEQRRPDLVIVDDPQTPESARSTTQCAARRHTLLASILGLAGPGQKIACLMPCTVIQDGDMADEMLNRELHPDWQGERTQILYEFPTNEDLWEKYREIRAKSYQEHGDIRLATEFYKKHRKEMDKGARVAWQERYYSDEVSALQHAMNLKFRDERAFWAEYMNHPLPDDLGEEEQITAEQVAEKLHGGKRYEVPAGASRLTCFVDVGGKLLHYCVCAWREDFTGYVVDYGEYPDQGQRHYASRNARRTLQRTHQGMGQEAAIYAGLTELVRQVVQREYRRQDGAILRVEQCLIDSGWTSDLVYQFCRQSPVQVVLASKGVGVGASGKPFSEYKNQRGDRYGLCWRMPSSRGKRMRANRLVQFDANFWKSFVHARLRTAMGDPGCLSLWGDKADRHRLFSEHITAEYYTRVEGRSRVVDEWQQRPDHPDNHWFDCLVGAAVAASMLGVILPGTEPERKQSKKAQKSFAEMRNERKAARR